MDGPVELSYCVKSDTEKQMPYDNCLYVESKKGTNELVVNKTEVESQMQKTGLWLPGDKGGGGSKMGETVIDTYT